MTFPKSTYDRLSAAIAVGISRAIKYKTICDHGITPDILLNKLILQDCLCTYCRADITTEPSLDHIRPLCKRGTHTLDNIHLICWSCNMSKGGKLYFSVEPSELIDLVEDFEAALPDYLDDEDEEIIPSGKL